MQKPTQQIIVLLVSEYGKLVFQPDHDSLSTLVKGLEYCFGKLDRDALEKRAERTGWDRATDKFSYPESVKILY